MNIDKAIEILEDSFCAQPQFADNPYSQAHKLGIEALKRLEEIRLIIGGLPDQLLPGETKE